MKTNVIPLPESKLVLFDLDKTIIDTEYRLTDGRFSQEIQQLIDIGWKFGLSSDTPLESLKNWYDQFGMNGPIIAERGSVIWFPDNKIIETTLYVDIFKTVKSNLVEYLIKKGYAFYFGDVTQVIRNKTTFPGLVEKRLVLVQAYRRCSFNFYGRKINQAGELEIDNEITEELHQIVMGEMPEINFLIIEDYNPEYGILILSPANVTKRSGTLYLLSYLGLDRIGMVGDSISDILGTDIAFHYAVGNATAAFKDIANYISTESFTSGVVDIISKFK